MMYPKQKTKKRRKHPPSIMNQEPGTCYLCVRLHGNYVQHKSLHKHHVFGGKNRKISEEHGLWVNLCWQHHTYGEEAAHENQKYLQLIQEDVQRAYEEKYSREQFWELFHENFIGRGDNGNQKESDNL